MKFLNILIFFLLLVSTCTKYSEVIRNNNILLIKIKDSGIKKVREIGWTIGYGKKAKVSKGFTMEIHFPRLKEKDMEEIVNKYKVDSWVFRLKRLSISGSTVLGTFYTPFYFKKSLAMKRLQFKKKITAYLHIFYPAAAVSSRFLTLPCPPFDHRNVIAELELTKRNVLDNTIVLGSFTNVSINARTRSISFQPYTINGGRDLIGDYLVEVAIYDSVTKKRKTSYIELPLGASVKKENQIILTRCDGYVPSLPENNKKSKFKFGR